MSIPRYPKYKASEVEWLGDVPAHWDVFRLKTLFEIRKRIAGSDDFDVLSITQRGIKVKDTESNDGQVSMDYAKYQLVYPGEFAMNHMDLLTGYVDLSRQLGITSPDYRVFALRDQTMHPRYYLYLLQNAYHQKLFYPFGQGSSQLGRWRLPAEQFNEFRFPKPPIEDQATIVEFLDRETAKIDALVEEQKRLIELLEEKRQAVITQAVTKGLNPEAPMKPSGVEWLGDVPAHWETSRLRYLARQIVDGAHFTPTYADEGVPFLRVTDITRKRLELDDVKRIPETEHLELLKRCHPKEGDLLLSKNGTIGVPRVVDWTWEFSIFVSLCLIKLSTKLNAHFASYVFQSSVIQLQINDGVKQSTVSNLHLEKISAFQFPLPTMQEQKEIVQWLNSSVKEIEKLAKVAEEAVELLQERRSALTSAAVTGKIDVRGILAKQEAA
jgi:type I restriction enzyme, S subunit